MHVVVSGPPAVGKSSFASRLARELGLPLLAKDVLKHALRRSLDPDGGDDVEASRRLGRASVRALVDLAEASVAEGGATGTVLDSVWVDQDWARARLAALPGAVVEVHLSAPTAVLRRRYAERAAASTDPAAGRDEDELWGGRALEPVAGGWPVVEVDATGPVDVVAVAGAVRSARGVRVTAEPGPGVGREVWALYQQVFGDAQDHAAWLRDVWLRHRSREDFRVARAHDGDTLVGAAHAYTGERGQWWTDEVERRLPRSTAATWLGGHLEVVSLAVSAHARRRGLGTALLRALVDSTEHERLLLMTTADPGDPARRLYEREGWRVLGAGVRDDQVVLGRLR
ncbi:GNAT family N-acetyltransferase [Nocardioides sp. Leaf374]|uniref:GNAT family N-acetyltransferase n=1 Tax=Nocardioides sp. Leaf374 TaxID=2876560 RepID=UPI001E309802|nr:GNAT family N-acetyltransferase [Nocardioides sp. Leaf374]